MGLRGIETNIVLLKSNNEQLYNFMVNKKNKTLKSLLAGLGNHIGCLGFNPSWLYARKVPYLLCYFSSLKSMAFYHSLNLDHLPSSEVLQTSM